jgi:hypothetical protein
MRSMPVDFSWALAIASNCTAGEVFIPLNDNGLLWKKRRWR